MDGRLRRGRASGLTAALCGLGLALVLLGLWLGARQLTAAQVTVPGGVPVPQACGSVFSHRSGVRSLSDALFSGREGCELALARAHVVVLAGLGIGTLLVAVAAVRLVNRVR